MEIQMIGANAVLVFANAAELDRRNMDAQTLELGDVLRLTREACRKGGIPWQDMREIEAYAAVLSEFGQVVSRCDQYQAEREGALILSETGVKELWGCLHP